MRRRAILARVVVAISYAAARLIQRLPSRNRLAKTTAEAVERGVMVAGRRYCRFAATDARALRAWCHDEADALRATDVHGATLLDGVAADITATLLQAEAKPSADRSKHS